MHVSLWAGIELSVSNSVLQAAVPSRNQLPATMATIAAEEHEVGRLWVCPARTLRPT